jgi:hypothetical protein
MNEQQYIKWENDRRQYDYDRYPTSGTLASTWDRCVDVIYPQIKAGLLPQETEPMFDPRSAMTRREVVMSKLMHKHTNRPACDAQLLTKRFDDEESFAEFCAKHEFITNIINWGHGSYEVEYLA